VSTDSPPLILEHLTTSDGLPQGTVFVTLQDSRGFVWLGTEDGLVRYDGHQLFRYAYSRSARGGLPGNYIEAIVEDARHDLWVAVKDRGVARWNRQTDDFTVYRHDPGDAHSLSSNAVHDLLVDPDGRVWVGTTDAGIDVLDPRSNSIEHLRHDPRNPASLIDDRIFSLTLDRAGTLWIGTENGLDRGQPQRRTFEHFRHEAGNPASLSGNQLSRVLEDPNGTLWVGTRDGGLDRMDQGGHVIDAYRHDPHRAGSLANDDVRAILTDHAGHLWIGTADGLDLLNRSTGLFSHYRHDTSDAESLRDSYVMSLYEDPTGLLWIGTRAGGVSRWNPRSWELGGHRPEWLGNKLVTAFADAPDNRVWIATLGGGLFQVDADTGRTVDIDALLGRPNAIGDGRVMSLLQDHTGTLWIGTMASGLRKLDPSGHLRSIPVKAGDPHSLSAPGIMTIYEARDGRIWAGTFGGGVNVIDPVTGLIQQLPHGSGRGTISSANVSSITQDRSGHFWIGTDGGGLDLARADGTVVSVYQHDPGNPASLPANTVYSLAVDAQDRMWVATDGGGLALVVGSPEAPDGIHFRILSREEGLSSDTVYGVLPDAVGRLWLSTDAGLMRLDPDSGAVKSYHREQGLQGEEFDSGAFFRLRDGRLCFGGPGGFNIFDPARLTENRRPPRLTLTRVEVMGVPAPGPKPYWLLERLALGYRDNIVSLDFGALDFTSPKRNRLAYRMGDLSDRWIDLGTQRRITLTNLDPGDHLLEVRAANSDSVWSETPLRLIVHRDHAPWRSPWAYTMYALAILGLAGYRARLQRMRFQRVVEERRHLESEVALRTRELLESNRQLEDASRAKSNFMDRMSHELRTPMNGVVGMTELLARTPLSSTQARLTQTIRSSAEVLLQIVNDLLDLSKINAGKVQLEALPVDLANLLEECTGLFAGAVETKRVDLVVCPPTSFPGRLIGDPLRIRQILMNLVGNAVKFTARGEVVIKADVKQEEPDRALIHFSVTDTGIGMDSETIGRIFKPFTQADESTTRRFGGTGLGLAICRELAELMGGSIHVESRPQMGSTFSVCLPVRVEAGQLGPPSRALPSRNVRILSRRPALAESLARYVAAQGLTPVVDGADTGLFDHSVAGALRDGTPPLVIVDASGEYECLKSLADTDGSKTSARDALIVVASAAEVESKGLESLVGSRAIVLKPVRRDALHEALAAASGVSFSPTEALTTAECAEKPIRAHVLLVEDEPVNAAVAQGYLSALGCTSMWVKDGPEAVARSAAERFDLILMDLSMPTMDGFATTALIRQAETSRRTRVPIVALTAHSSASYRETCVRGGMDDLLSKPYTLDECARLVRRWALKSPDLADRPAPAAPAADTRKLSTVDPGAVAGLRNLGGQADLFSKLVDLFQGSSSVSLTQLRGALAAGDLAAAAAACHKFASSAANVGALSFAQDVRQLEQLCLNGNLTAALATCERLSAAHPELIQQLLSMRLRATA